MSVSHPLLSSRLAALAQAGFVPTASCVQERLRHLVTLPTRGRYTVLDPTCGRGDFLAPFDGPLADLFGVELNRMRAHEARTRFPRATIVHAPFEETAISRGRVSLALANFPYMYQDGERVEHLGLVEVTPTLLAGGVLLMQIPARSACNRRRAPVLINHLVKHYTAVRIWKVPDAEFVRYTQIVIGAVKRAQALKTVDDALDEKHWLEQFIFHDTGEGDEREHGLWRGGTAPPELPTAPLATPYHVPIAPHPLHLRVFRPDRALLLQYLSHHGVQTTTEWQQATCWSPDVTLEQPLVPIVGEAHIAAFAMLDLFACEEFRHTDGTRYTFLAHLGKTWAPVEPDGEERKEGVVEIRQEQDHLQLAVLNMSQGTLTQYQGDAVHTFLEPWLPTIKQRVQQRSPPLYDGRPARWLVEATATIGLDRTLKGASLPGLVRPQLETVWAMWTALCTKGYVGLAGEQGVGKTRLTITLMAAFAAAWQQAPAVFEGQMPRWIRRLTRAWARNPLVPGSRPLALPCLIVCPLHVIESVWQAEIRAAWPEAECIIIDDYQDIRTWFARCASSRAPAVIALLSQSKTRATRRCWRPAVLRRERIITQLDLSDAAHEAGGMAERDAHGTLLCYRHPLTGDPITTVTRTSRFFCPHCGQLIVAHPMGTKQRGHTAALDEGDAQEASSPAEADADAPIRPSRSAHAQLDQERMIPVESLTYFAFQPRVCSCGSPLWTAARTEAVERKHPRLSYAEWVRAMEALMATITHEPPAAQQSGPDLEACKAQDGRPLVRLAAMPERTTGPVGISIPDLSIDTTHPLFEQGEHIGYQLPTGEQVTIVFAWRTRRRYGYVSQTTGLVLMQRYGFVAPPADSFSPFAYLKQYYPGLVAFTLVDESHNARNRDTDVGEAIQQAQMASQTFAHATGTPYGGLLKSFYYEQARLHIGFWHRLGFGWRDMGKAQAAYGFSRVVTYEHEEQAHRGSGRLVTTEVRQSAPGLAVSLMPHLCSEWIDLSLDMLGAHLPERIETPLLISMEDPIIEERRTRMHQRWREAYWQERAAQEHYEATRQTASTGENEEAVAQAFALWQEAQTHLYAVEDAQRAEQTWIAARDLHAAYRRAAAELRTLAVTHDAAKLAQDWLLRLWATLPFCDTPRYAIAETSRSAWGDVEARHQLYQMPCLAEDYLYPLERQCYEVVAREVAAGRPIAIAFLQNGKRNTATRLQWVLRDFHPWTLTNDIAPNEREPAVKHAVAAGYMVLLLPFQRTREGYNFQKEIPSGFWYEMPDRLFDLEQWQRRFWRLGQEREVHLYFPAMIGTATFMMLSRLGMMSAGLSLFLGKTPTSGLARLVGAHTTALARLSAALAHSEEGQEEQSEASMSEQIMRAFEQRNAEYRALTSSPQREQEDEVQDWIEQTRRRALGLPDRHPMPEPAYVSSMPAPRPSWEECRQREQTLRLAHHQQRMEDAREKARARRLRLRSDTPDPSAEALPAPHAHQSPSRLSVLQGTLW